MVPQTNKNVNSVLLLSTKYKPRISPQPLHYTQCSLTHRLKSVGKQILPNKVSSTPELLICVISLPSNLREMICTWGRDSDRQNRKQETAGEKMWGTFYPLALVLEGGQEGEQEKMSRWRSRDGGGRSGKRRE